MVKKPQILVHLGIRDTRNDRYMAIIIRDNDRVKYYLAFTDNLGSILYVMDDNGTKAFDASYDAWGKQTGDTQLHRSAPWLHGTSSLNYYV